MIRGTTAQFRFKLPYPRWEFKDAVITFWQPSNPNFGESIKKKLEQCDNFGEASELCVALTAKETARFSDKFKAKVQLRAFHMASGTIIGCPPQTIPVYPMSDELIEEDLATIADSQDAV